MHSLSTQISDIKSKLIEKDIKAIQKYKLKSIKEDIKTINVDILNEYNYYMKLLKKINIHIKKQENIVILVEQDLDEKLVYVIATIDLSVVDVEIPIHIKVIGAYNESYMECSYYEGSRLYIKYFRSRKSNQGYGAIILRNLEDIVNGINKILSKYDLNNISMIEGKVIPDKNIINYKNLRNMYTRYGFDVDDRNNLIKILSINNKI